MPQKIFSPYRICPIGAHVDHQGGIMLGRTLQYGTTLTYEPSKDEQFRIFSEQLGEAVFIPADEIDHFHWARYAQGAARVFGSRINRGIQAHVRGDFIGAGLSSSASVGLAYLKAIADVNDIEITKEQLVQMDYQLENGVLGLMNGLLDPMTIVYGKKNALLYMDSTTATATIINDPPSNDGAWIVAYTGVSRELTKSGFNSRVLECQEAAGKLINGAAKLSDIPEKVFEENKHQLPLHLRHRVNHYFSEVERVRQGAKAWEIANLPLFGDLMNRSCQSSIEDYGVGSPTLIELHEIASQTTGVYGSRFSGGGYAGCVIALVKRELADSARLMILEAFSSKHPELQPNVFIAEMGDGLQ